MGVIDVDWEEDRGSDVEELREVLSAVSEFLDKLPELVKKVLDALYSKDLGERVGDSVATFYRKLRESGMPEDMVNKMTMEFFDRSMIVDRLVREIVGSIRKELSEEEESGDEEEEI
ncbi:MAG: hypothetical protein QI223_02505 [Candidatus Korarchaeota archaeon]|nr:hypothetical protein [Candidatus Korarchaeota archaeon]